MTTQTFSLDLGGKILTAEWNDWAIQANGSITLRYGETVVLVTAVMSDRANQSLPYLPLSVEFEEKFYAAGAILGSRFMRREGKPSDQAILSARMIDRTIRPLFDHTLRHDIQIVATVLAVGEDNPDVLGIIGASLALGISDIPFNGPVAAVRIAQSSDSGAIVINPGYAKQETGEHAFEVLACGKHGLITMIEAAAKEVTEEDIAAVLEAASVLHARLEDFQCEIIKKIGKPKRHIETRPTDPQLLALFKSSFSSTLCATLFSKQTGKSHISALKKEWLQTLTEANISPEGAGELFDEQVNEEIHRGALDRHERADGRTFDEVRPLYAGVGGISPVLHGSGTFYRGETHMVAVLTLGGKESAQTIDTIEEQSGTKRFIHHYNFPPYSVGETGRVGGFNRRMIGHGALAEKALLPVIPPETQFPYTIRVVSETLSSNGSSSMGAVCASTLALMDGGVPITRPVAGIASGVMIRGEEYAVLTDIQGPEDEYGDMDFKVAGTSVGITAIQMDVKVHGVTLLILNEALFKTRLARLHILAVMKEAIDCPRPNISARAPEIITLTITREQIGLVIGSGGKTINKIKQESGVTEITIEDSGAVYITGTKQNAQKAAEEIAALTKQYQVGEVVCATVTRITPFGAFAQLDKHHEGLIHISEVAPFRLETLDGVLTEGEALTVVVIKNDEGKIGLSIKRIDQDFAERKGLKTA